MLIPISDNATLQDTINLIINTINEYQGSGFVKKLSADLQPEGSKLEFVKRLFAKICREIKYEKDTDGHEIVSTPEAMFRQAKGDCKKMTTAIAAVLKNVGIEPLLAIISYDGEKYEHIFPMAKINGEFITIDPVNDCKFNEIIPHKKAVVYNLKGNAMQLSLLKGNNTNTSKSSMFSNIAGNMNEQMQQAAGVGFRISTADAQELYKLTGIEELDTQYDAYVGRCNALGKAKKTKAQRVEKRKAIFAKVVNVVKKGTAAPLRGAFLGLLMLGKLAEKYLKIHVAQRMAQAYKKDPAKVERFWKAFGGDVQELKKAIVKGTGAPLSGIDRDNMGMGSLASIAASITLAMPLIIASKNLFKELGIIKPGAAEDTASETVIEAAEDAVNDDGSIPGQPAAPGTPTAGSFHQATIDNFSEFLNFCKAAGVLNLGAQLHPVLILPTAVFSFLSFLYAMRKNISRLINYKTFAQ